MKEEKNEQSKRLGDTAFEAEDDVASYMKPGKMEKRVDSSISESGGYKPDGVKTPGNPRL